MLFTVVKYYIEKTYYSRTGRGEGGPQFVVARGYSIKSQKAICGRRPQQKSISDGQWPLKFER